MTPRPMTPLPDELRAQISGVAGFLIEALHLASARSEERPITSLTEARQLVGDEAAAWHKLLCQGPECLVKHEKSRHHLLVIAATCLQAAGQLGLATRSDAISKDIAF